MNVPSLPELRTQLDAIDTCLRKYVRMRAILIEVIAFMDDEQEQEHLRLVRERSKMHPAGGGVDQDELNRVTNGHFRPKPAPSADEFSARRSPAPASTMSVEA